MVRSFTSTEETSVPIVHVVVLVVVVVTIIWRH